MATLVQNTGNRRLRVMQYVNILAFGGAERVATDLAVELAARGADVVVAADTSAPKGFAGRLARAGIPTEHVPFVRARPLALWRSAWRLAAVIRKHEPQVVHAHNPAAGTAATLARRLARRPHVAVVTTYHGVRPSRLRLAGRVLRGGELVVAVGPSAGRQLSRVVPERRLVVVPNAVSVRIERDRETIQREFGSEHVPLLVSVARYVEQKGHALLIDSLAELARAGHPFRALLIGSGPLHADLEARVRDRGLDERVLVTGSRSDAVDIVAAADVFLHAAEWEGLPLVLLETMTVGTPVVALAAPGVTDLIADGSTGLLVTERSPVALADAVGRLLRDESLRQRVASEARSFVEQHHSFSRMVDDHLAVYRRALELRGEAAR